MKKYVGEIFKTNNYGDLVVTEWVSWAEVHVRFLNTSYETITSSSSIKKGAVRDRFVPSVWGVGVIGDEVTRINGVDLKEYILWRNMLGRCYNPEYQLNFPTYKGCTVADHFKYYPNFKAWCNRQVGFNENGWVLDKDIILKGNKVYSGINCCFVPHEINNLFVKSDARRENLPIGVTFNKSSNNYTAQYSLNGRSKYIGNYESIIESFEAYRKVKELHIKFVADRWRNLIDHRTYEALMNYKVEVTD